MNMELKDTVDMMLSDDYTERFRAEYWQAKIRYNKLNMVLKLHDAGKLGFELNCPVELLRKQKKHMGKYIDILEHRAKHIEGVTL